MGGPRAPRLPGPGPRSRRRARRANAGPGPPPGPELPRNDSDVTQARASLSEPRARPSLNPGRPEAQHLAGPGPCRARAAGTAAKLPVAPAWPEPRNRDRHGHSGCDRASQ